MTSPIHETDSLINNLPAGVAASLSSFAQGGEIRSDRSALLTMWGLIDSERGDLTPLGSEVYAELVSRRIHSQTLIESAQIELGENLVGILKLIHQADNEDEEINEIHQLVQRMINASTPFLSPTVIAKIRDTERKQRRNNAKR